MNYTIETDWGYISYLADSSADPFVNLLDTMLVAMIDGSPEILTGSEIKSTEETAIIVEGAGEEGRPAYYILYGDWRNKLHGRSLSECIKVFWDNPQQHGHSTDYPEKGMIIQ